MFDETSKRMVYLPEGSWTDWWTEEECQGLQWIQGGAGIEKIPLYRKTGATIKMAPDPA